MAITRSTPCHLPATISLARATPRNRVNLVVAAAAVNGRDCNAALRVAFQGAPGSYSEHAARAAMPSCATVPCRTFSDAVAAVESGAAERAVIPVEFTMEGSALRNYDLLLQRDVVISGEVSLFVHYCLLAMPGVRTAELRRVISHPTALAHCGRALALLGPGIVSEPVDDTAGAVKMLRSQQLLDTAAIASPRAALLYGLDVLAAGLQDESWNVTRFVLLAKPQPAPFILAPAPGASKMKTSLVIAHRGASMAAVLRVLNAFSSRNINLTKLEVINSVETGAPVMILDSGRSLRAFPHALCVDCEGEASDGAVKSAIEEMHDLAATVRVLGSYAADTHIYDLQ